MIFISYNHNDEEIVDRIVKRLDIEFGRKKFFMINGLYNQGIVLLER